MDREEADRGSTPTFNDGARKAPLEASIAAQDAANATAEDLMLSDEDFSPPFEAPSLLLAVVDVVLRLLWSCLPNVFPPGASRMDT